jgi:EAL domain-containing protein (putative c-di-GMP-specific phosphodiesterase class I)
MLRVALAAAVAILRLPSPGPQLLALEITLEITEASILERYPATEANLEQFRRQGYHFQQPKLVEA